MGKLKQFSQQDIQIIKEEPLYNGFFHLKKVYFRHKLFAGGESGNVTRELLVKGAASVVVAYDPVEDSVVMVEQVRIGAYDPQSTQSPWLLELIAGMVEEGELPNEVAQRESQEEAGVQVEHLREVMSFWDSPGGIVERIHLFVGKVDSRKAQGIHGLADENEDIRVHVIPRQTAYDWVCNGNIDNGLAVTGLLWLQLNYQSLQNEWNQ
ncbi:ADP-ribose diphosphatase [Avibacterium paragallinarum]|uniref:ADP-ribose pyrophosphatase n=1 Tax=Avibacterium paragallinarum TaxID=728 RepID=A0A8B3TGX0_AVIPA|nr:ADP-ribose diphosphatase [Avibacterium paragallinarum]RZN59523.1 ADP-ribose diphosphatase [Avibacterium paragallinarum]